ncbi:MAG: thiol reductant ABC exporter subunit CydC [Acidiphilium sp. 34-60-192]|nr:MAG: thiol reductant ABC exporter subunit CydC [Acidiphilium sp. 34-60-192]
MHDLLRLYRLFRPSLTQLLAGIGLASIVILANAGLVALAGWFIAAMALSGLGGPLLNYFAPAAAIRGLAILRTGGRYSERLLTHDATLRLLATLRVWFYTRLEPLAPARLQHYRGGDLLSRIRADIDSLDNFYLRVLVPVFAAILTACMIGAFIAAWSGKVALVDGSGLLLVGLVLPWLAFKLARPAANNTVWLRAGLRADLADTVRGLGELQIYRAAERQSERIAAKSQELVSAQRRLAGFNGFFTGLTSFTTQAAMGLALIIAIPLVVHGRISGPDLPMLALLVLGSFEAVVTLPAAFQALGETLAAVRRIFEIIDAKPSIAEPSDPAPTPLRYDLQITGLCMRYAPEAAWALDHFSLSVEAGARVGIVGASGAGKTSLLNVLLRFWDFQEGVVTIGGVTLRDLTSDAARALFAVVAQQTHLFNVSIRENLLLAKPDAPEAELWMALEQAQLAALVRALPHGLDSLVGEAGANFSGGEARRIAIARAFLKDAPILILDEPTEGLDATAEHLVLAALDGLMRGRTTILISHRPSSLRHVDRVITLERGKIVNDRLVAQGVSS